MATLSVGIIQHHPSQSNSQGRAAVSITVTYTTSQGNSAVTISATNISVGAISTAGNNASAKTAAKSALTTALSSMTAKLMIYNGATIVSKTGLAPSASYTVSGSTQVNRETSAKTIALDFYGGNKYSVVNITIPALQSWSIVYDGRSGRDIPTTQTKYYGINIKLDNTHHPTKDGYTFRGWAVSEPDAKAGIVSNTYRQGATYNEDNGKNLYAVWELNYNKPTISGVDIERCLQNGQEQDDGGYALVKFNWSVFKTNEARYYGGSNAPYANNTADVNNTTVKINSFTVTPTLTATGGTAIVGNGNFNPDAQYNVSISLADTQQVVTTLADHTTTVTGILSKAKFPIDINADATAIAFLSTAPDDDEGVFSPDMTTEEIQDFVDNLESGGGNGTADRVIEQGTASTAVASNIPATWIYRKWSSGISECFGQVNVDSRTYTANGGYYGFNFNYPPNLFISNPICLEVSGGLSGTVNTDIGFTANNNATQGQTYLINRNGSAVTAAGWVFIHAVGMWK